MEVVLAGHEPSLHKLLVWLLPPRSLLAAAGD